jgi:glycosyltransferase involved in cell wall biosynthesis
MMHPSQQTIALLIIEPDQQHSNSELIQDAIALSSIQHIHQQHQQITQLASALAKTGWQVDQFVGRISNKDGNWSANHYMTAQHSPNHCKIYIDATDTTQFVQEFRKFAIQEGRNYPLIHTWNGLAGQVGLQLKQSENIQWIHSHWQYDKLWSRDGLEIAQQTSGYSSAYVAWEIWRYADEIIVFTPNTELTSCDFKISLPGKIHQPSSVDAKRKLGFSASDPLILWMATFAQSTGQEIQQVEQWLEVAVQLNQLSTTQLHRFPRHQWVFIPGTLNSAEDPAVIRSVIQQKIAQLNLRDIHWSVPCASEDLELYYRAANVCVLANWNEPFADKALEAIAHGCPVVVSQWSGARFAAISKETGIRVTNNTPAAWAEAIAQVLRGKSWVQRLQQYASGHWHPTPGWAIAAAQLSEVYRRLLAQTISRIPLWQSQKPYLLWLPQPAAVANFTDFKQKVEKLHPLLNPQVTMPLLTAESVS